MKHSVLLLAFATVVSAETFPATLVKSLWRDGKGILEIDDQGIRYTANAKRPGGDPLGVQRAGRALESQANRPPTIAWKWLDIQYFDRVSRKEFVVLTYKDDWRMLGRDKEYRFRLTEGELSDALFQSISEHLKRPVTDRVPPSGMNPVYAIPVKREGTFGGSEGELEFTDDAIAYITNHQEDGRTWRLDRDIVSVWSNDPYRLEIRAYDNNRREFSRTATYKFDLKEKLDPAFYRQLKLKLYNLEANGQVIR